MVGCGLCMYDVFVKRSRSLSYLLISSCLLNVLPENFQMQMHTYTITYRVIYSSAKSSIKSNVSMAKEVCSCLLTWLDCWKSVNLL